ncbi:RNA-directed DNA polymerase, eukaryota, reverse transcriptase zinc-binding domain protein [Tanacetum coccineum]
MLKKPLRKLNFEHGNLFANVEKLKLDLVANPHSSVLREEELSCLKAYKAALKDEELFLKQKSKIDWLSEGDRNSKYFHNVIKGRVNKSRISVIEDMCGNSHYGLAVGDQFVSYFQKVLGSSSKVLPINEPEMLFSNVLSDGDAKFMVRNVSDDEVKKAIFDIDDNKAPGPDGYSSHFFKASWDIVGKDVCKAVKEFFGSGKLLKEVNSTVISLVPKLSTPRKVSDFRPISCCNVVYKCISKIIVNRIKGCLDSLVDKNQSAFIPSRQISDNILLSQELLKGYHRNRGYARCAFKVDIQKAYDSVELSLVFITP